jgi:outer membrane protein assembly factor BamB
MGNKLVVLSLALVLVLSATLFSFWGREGDPARAADGLAGAPWPMEAHDPQHTGRSLYSGPQVPYLKWTYKADGAITHSPLIGSDDTIYFCAMGGSFHAVNPDGTLKWSYKLMKGEDFVTFSPALGSDGTIYFGSQESEEGKLYALSPEGDVRWSLQFQGIVSTAITIGEDGTLYFGLDVVEGGTLISTYLYALNPDGSLRWRQSVDYSFGCVVIGHDGTIYSEELDPLNPDGTFKGYEKSEAWYDPAIGSDDTIYSCSDYLRAYNPDCSIKWEIQEVGVYLRGRPAIGSDGTIYVHGRRGRLEFDVLSAFDPDGNVKWTYQPDSWMVSSDLTIDRDGNIYFCSPEGQLYAFDSNGTQKWICPIGEEVLNAPTIGSDGTTYLGSTEGTLYAIGDLPESLPPKAEFSINAAEARVGQKVQFASSSTGLVTSSLWDFGDGMKLEGTEGEVSHTYLTEGSYTVSLTVSNPWGSDTVSKSLLVQPALHKGRQLLWLWVVIGVAVAFAALGIVIKRRLTRG